MAEDITKEDPEAEQKRHLQLTQDEVDIQKIKYDEWLAHFKHAGVGKTPFGIWLACAKWNDFGTKVKHEKKDR